jgi:hypothetical protein
MQHMLRLSEHRYVTSGFQNVHSSLSNIVTLEQKWGTIFEWSERAFMPCQGRRYGGGHFLNEIKKELLWGI